MKIRNRLAKYKSKGLCNLDMFRLPAMGHDSKTWETRNGRKLLIRDMDTMHLWNTYRMLLKTIDLADSVTREMNKDDIMFSFPDFQGEMAQLEASRMLDFVLSAYETAEASRNALQYIGHELYKRQMGVPKLPEKNLKKNINRAENLNEGFSDKGNNIITWV